MSTGIASVASVALMIISPGSIIIGLTTLMSGFKNLMDMSGNEKAKCGTHEVLQMMYGLIWVLLPMFFWLMLNFFSPGLFTKID